METSIKLKPSEINENLLHVLQRFFNGKDNFEITINVKEISNNSFLAEEPKEEYLQRLNKSVENIENNKDLVSFTFEEFENFSKTLQNK